MSSNWTAPALPEAVLLTNQRRSSLSLALRAWLLGRATQRYLHGWLIADGEKHPQRCVLFAV